jgi:hypothetical protein
MARDRQSINGRYGEKGCIRHMIAVGATPAKKSFGPIGRYKVKNRNPDHRDKAAWVPGKTVNKRNG